MRELTRRYVVMALATEAPFDLADRDAPFVLRPWKDPAALRALGTYADHCYPELARDLRAWIDAIERGAVVRGGIGRRNEEHLSNAAGSRRTRGAEKPRTRRASARPKPTATIRPKRSASSRTRRRRR